MAGLSFLGLLAYGQRGTLVRGETDFTAFYIGGRLAGSGQLYDREANYREMRSIHREIIAPLVYIRPPFQALLFRPLTWLPYRTAFLVFVSLSLVASVWFVWRFSGDLPELPVFAALCLPLLASLMNGQDTALLLALVGASVVAARRERGFLAGLLLSLCAAKAHLFLLVPLAVPRAGRRRILAGGVAGGAVLLAMSYAAGGWGWPSQFLDALSHPVIEPHRERMPNLRGAALAVGGDEWGIVIEALLALVVVGMLAVIARFRPRYETMLGAALIGGLLIARHTALMDYVLLLAAMPLLLGGERPPASRKLLPLAMTLAVTPPAHLLALAWDYGHLAVVTVMLLALGAMAWEAAGSRQEAEVKSARYRCGSMEAGTEPKEAAASN